MIHLNFHIDDNETLDNKVSEFVDILKCTLERSVPIKNSKFPSPVIPSFIKKSINLKNRMKKRV